jgi:hypothetical protein
MHVCLHNKINIKFSMIKFSNTSTNPKAMMIKFRSTSLADFTVSRSVMHELITVLAKFSRGFYLFIVTMKFMDFGYCRT